MINNFNFLQAKNIKHAVDVLAREERVCPVVGGTNVLVNMKRGPLPVDTILDLSGLSALRSITTDDGIISLGAGVNVAELLEWSKANSVAAELFSPMCSEFAGPLIRNLATVGGNICDASPASDLAPPLLALDASVVLASKAREIRKIKLADFFQGVRLTDRLPDELMTHIEFQQPNDEIFYYYKLGKRKADAISIVSVAISIKYDKEKVKRARIALGASAPTPFRSKSAEEVLFEKVMDPQIVDSAAAAAVADSNPIDDHRASAEYRRRMIEVLIKRGLTKIADERVNSK